MDRGIKRLSVIADTDAAVDGDGLHFVEVVRPLQ